MFWKATLLMLVLIGCGKDAPSAPVGPTAADAQQLSIVASSLSITLTQDVLNRTNGASVTAQVQNESSHSLLVTGVITLYREGGQVLGSAENLFVGTVPAGGRTWFSGTVSFTQAVFRREDVHTIEIQLNTSVGPGTTFRVPIQRESS